MFVGSDSGFNYIHNIATIMTGVIYMELRKELMSNAPHQCSIMIFLHLSGYGSHGIYLDECVSGFTVFGNLLFNISHHGIHHSMSA